MKTILGKDIRTGEKIRINDKERRSGTYILGATGQGKSLLEANLICQDAEKGYAVIVFDPHGDLIDHVIGLLPEDVLKKTYLLDMTDKDFPFGLNLFSCPDPGDEIERAIAVDRVMHVFEKIWPEVKGVLLEKLLRYVTLTLLEHPECTLVDIRHLLRDDAFRANIVSTLSNAEVKAYWEEEYNTMTPGERRKETMALDNRLATFRSVPFLRNIVGQQHNTIDMRRAIEEHQVLLIRLPMEQMKNSASLVGTILLAQVHAATFSFADLPWDQRPGFSLYIDEFQHFATADFAVLLKEGRKFGVRITVAHQDRRALLPENRSATLGASIIICFRPTPDDALEIAPIFFDSTISLRPERIYPDVIRRLRLHEHREVQDYQRRYVLPLQKSAPKHSDNQDILDSFQDLVYQAVKTENVNEELFEIYVQHMFSHLKLTFDAPHRRQKRLQKDLRLKEYEIAKLTSFLASDQAFELYLTDFYTYYSLYPSEHLIDWYYQPWVPKDHLLSDAKLWGYVLGYRSYVPWKSHSLESVIASLREEAAANDTLRYRDTPEKLIADEKGRIINDWKSSYQQLWASITTIHELNGKYATNEAVRAFHKNVYQTCLTTPLERKGDPVYLHVVGSRTGSISNATRVEELIVHSLPFLYDNAREAAKWLPGAPDGIFNDTFLRPRGKEEMNAFHTVETIWRSIFWQCDGIQKLRRLLADDTAILKAYYARVGWTWQGKPVWEELNNENVDTNVWQALQKEVQRNTLLSSEMNTYEKLIEVRKSELRRKITLLTEERDMFVATLPSIERRIEKDIAAIEEQRTAFCTTVRHILEILIRDPGSLGEKRIPKEGDIKEKLLNLPKRQALARVGGDIEQRPRKYTMQTLDAPQAVRKYELERRLHLIQEQTRAKYCRPRSVVEQAFRYMPMDNSDGEEKHYEDEPPDSWYEE